MSKPEIRPLNAELQAIAKEQLFEDPEKIQENLEVLREWIRKSAHLKSRTDDQFLMAFLRGCKFSLERAKQKLDMFYTLRTHIPELMDRDPLNPKLHAIIKCGSILPLPELEHPGGPRLMLFRPGACDPSKFTMEEIMKVSMIINDILMKEDDNMIVAGQVEVGDMSGMSLGHMRQMQPALMKKMTMLMQEGAPIRQKGMHHFNAPPAFEKVFNIFKTFMNEKMKSRIYVYSSFESMYKVVPRRLMPSDYEGEAASIASLTEEWEKKILAHRDYLLDEANYGVDEKKRIGRPKNPDSLFGIDGTFRQLTFD